MSWLKKLTKTHILLVAIVLVGLVAGGIYLSKGSGGGTGTEITSSKGYYTCGMHPSVRSDNPDDKCPICAMDLTFVEPESSQPTQATAAAKKGHYSCPRHPFIKSDDPGECLVCGTDLAYVEAESEGETASSGSKEIDYYTCAMHPSVRSQNPDDKCPICHMDLVPVYKADKSAANNPNVVGTIRVSTSENPEIVNLKVEKAEKMILHKTISVSGTFNYNERKLKTVAARIDGRIERLFVDFTGAQVKKGQPLLSIYSPDLVSTQTEYLQAIDNYERVKNSPFKDTVSNAKELLEATKSRLLLWGVTQGQLNQLVKRRKASNKLSIYSPLSGVVIKKNAVEGKYFKEGQVFYEIADLSSIWLYADIYENEIPWVKTGQLVIATTVAMPGEEFKGKITFIDPVLNKKTRTVRIRAEFDNKDLQLKPEMYATVKLVVPTPKKVISIKKSAVLDTGLRKVVYVQKSDNEFWGMRVKTGIEAENYVQILAGLEEGDKVVSDANFLIDSQSQLSGAQESLFGNALEVEEKDKDQK